MSMFSASFSNRDEIHLAPTINFDTFDQCNHALHHMSEINLSQYLEFTKHVRYHTDFHVDGLMQRVEADWMTSFIQELINMSVHDARAFRISVNTLDKLGFETDSYKSKLPQWLQSVTNKHDSHLKKELRFLKQQRLVDGLDYTIINRDLGGEVISIGYNITRPALYKLVSRRYGSPFLEALLSRMGQILYFYNQYKIDYASQHIDSLNRTIIGLNDDIKLLHDQLKDRRSVPVLSYNSYLSDRESTFEEHNDRSNDSDDISSIHELVNDCFANIGARINELNLQLSNVVNKIDTLTGSIAMTTDNPSRVSSCSNCSYDYLSARGSIDNTSSNGVLHHVENIFREYRQMDSNIEMPISPLLNQPLLNHRYTCIGNEHSL